jgi:hypothetical protein
LTNMRHTTPTRCCSMPPARTSALTRR